MKTHGNIRYLPYLLHKLFLISLNRSTHKLRVAGARACPRIHACLAFHWSGDTLTDHPCTTGPSSDSLIRLIFIATKCWGADLTWRSHCGRSLHTASQMASSSCRSVCACEGGRPSGVIVQGSVSHEPCRARSYIFPATRPHTPPSFLFFLLRRSLSSLPRDIHRVCRRRC